MSNLPPESSRAPAAPATPPIAGQGAELSVDPAWEVHPAAVKASMDRAEELFLLDVRRPDEWAVARIPGAVLVPLQELAARVDELSSQQNRRVVVYCHHGARSLRATALLRQKGFIDVHSMAGGIDAYTLTADATIPRYR